MKVIFLDVDGVLNSQELAKKNKESGLSGYGGWFRDEDACEHSNVLWGHKLVENLKRIVDATGAEIVISSTWRCHFTISKFKEMFEVYGWHEAPIIDSTPRLAGDRGNEIQAWLEGKRVSAYVILDDGTDFHDHQKPFFVNTDFMTGLSERDAERAISILCPICH